MTDLEYLSTAIVAGSGALTIIAKGIISILRRITRSQDQATAALLESTRVVARFTARIESLEKHIERGLAGRESRPASRRAENRMRETKPMRTIARDPREENHPEDERPLRLRGRARTASEDAPDPIAQERSARHRRSDRDPEEDLDRDESDPSIGRDRTTRESDR